jgi:hypothetical protein
MSVLRAWLDGRELVQRLSAWAEYDWTALVAAAQIEVPVEPSWARYYDVRTREGSVVTLVMGPDPAHAYHRFQGLLVAPDRTNWPRSVTLLCMGLLGKMEHDECSNPDGMDMSNDGAGATDQAQVLSLMDGGGLSDADLARLGGARGINGTGKLLGTIAPYMDGQGNLIGPFTWRYRQTRLAYCVDLDKACFPYRLFETFGGTIVRHPVTLRPASVPVLTFEEGVNIFPGARSRENWLGRKNKVVVTGCDDDTGQGPVRYTYPEEDAAGVSYRIEPWDSDKIERELESDPGDGLSCEGVALEVAPEYDLVQVEVEFDTPSGEMIGPGQTHKVTGKDNTADRLGVSQTMVVRGVRCGVDNRAQWNQHLTMLAAKDGTTVGVDPGPWADFSMYLRRELVVSGSSEVPFYEVTCVPAALPLSGSITDYSWTATDGTPSSGGGSTFNTGWLNPAGKTITLQVTDSGGRTATITKAVPPSTAVQWTRRPIYDAAKVHAEAFDGATTRTDAQDAAADVLVCSNGPVWGAGDKVMYSSDYLVSSAGESTPKSGVNVTALYVETDISANKVLAGLADGSVAINTSGGA